MTAERSVLDERKINKFRDGLCETALSIWIRFGHCIERSTNLLDPRAQKCDKKMNY